MAEKDKDGVTSPTPQDPNPVEPKLEVKEGKVIVDQDHYTGIVNDMKKYKNERTELREKVAEYEERIKAVEDADKERKEKELEEQGKYKELVEAKEKEINDMQIKFNEQMIDSALKTKALELGINKADDVALIDRSKIEIDKDTKKILGIDEALNSLKETRPYLFGGNTPPPTDPLKPGGVPANLTWGMLMADPKLAMKVKIDDPALYDRLKKSRK